MEGLRRYYDEEHSLRATGHKHKEPITYTASYGDIDHNSVSVA